MSEERITEEWAVRAVWAEGDVEVVERPNEEFARYMADYWNSLDRGPNCTVLRRRIVTRVGEWESA